MQKTIEAKLIPGFDNFTISENGEVTNIKTGNILKPWTSLAGSLCVSLEQLEVHSAPLVKKLLVDAFIEADFPEDWTSYICKDGDPTNLSLHNLTRRSLGFSRLYQRQFKRHNRVTPIFRPIECIETYAVYPDTLTAAIHTGHLHKQVIMSVESDGKVPTDPFDYHFSPNLFPLPPVFGDDGDTNSTE